MRRAWLGLLPILLLCLTVQLVRRPSGRLASIPSTAASTSARLAELINDFAQQETSYDPAALVFRTSAERSLDAEQRARKIHRDAERMLDLASRATDQPVVIEALTRIVAAAGESAEAQEAAARLERDYLASPTLASTARRLGESGSSLAARVLRSAAQASPHPAVRGFAEFALAKLLADRVVSAGWADSPTTRNAAFEAEKMLAHVVASYGELSDSRGQLADLANEQLDALHLVRAGQTALRGRKGETPYVGASTCRQCHPGESAQHARSGHGRTLQAAGKHPVARTLADRVVRDPEFPDVSWRFALRGEELSVERREGGQDAHFLLDYAFGSGRHAVTFVAVTDPHMPTGVEHRLTYFHNPERVGITPGQAGEQELVGRTPHGRTLSPQTTRLCFGCHSTPTTARGVRATEIATLTCQVSCERCHGPGLRHVEAARRGEDDLTMPFGAGEASAERLIRLCGECHRHPSQTPPNAVRADNPQLARFQPIGLTRSKCYRASAGGLTCVTCHDPHVGASSERSSYDASCLSCHSGPSQTLCKTSRNSGCIDCHMPRVDTGQHVLFTDHWIRVR